MKPRKTNIGGSFGSPFFGNIALRLKVLAQSRAALGITILIHLQSAARLLPFLPALWLD